MQMLVGTYTRGTASKGIYCFEVDELEFRVSERK